MSAVAPHVLCVNGDFFVLGHIQWTDYIPCFLCWSGWQIQMMTFSHTCQVQSVMLMIIMRKNRNDTQQTVRPLTRQRLGKGSSFYWHCLDRGIQQMMLDVTQLTNKLILVFKSELHFTFEHQMSLEFIFDCLPASSGPVMYEVDVMTWFGQKSKRALFFIPPVSSNEWVSKVIKPNLEQEVDSTF